jgi:Zn ribbon nucleic-acid-binding protein
MASQLAKAHIEGERRIREYAKRGVGAAWLAQGAYDKETLPSFLRAALPSVQAAKRASVALTGAYIARSLERQPTGIDISQIVAGVRNGVNPAEVYTRPYKRVWRALKEGVPWAEAVRYGLDSAVSSAATDVQLAMRDTMIAFRETDENLFGYQRVADASACPFCQELDGAQFRTDDPMPIHNNCGCGFEPVVYTRGVENARNEEIFQRILNEQGIPPSVAIENHGELGPVLGDPAHNFTSQSDL